MTLPDDNDHPGNAPRADADPAPATADVERAGRAPPSPAGLEETAAALLEDVERADDVLALRLSLVAGAGRDVAERLLAALSEQVTVVGSTLSDGWDPDRPRLDVLVETDHDRETVAGTLADLDPVEGVVVGEVRLAGDAADAADGEALSIYRLDDHLLVTDDFEALVERFDAALGDRQARAAARQVAEDVEVLRERLDAVAGRVESVERHLDALDGAVDATAETAEGAAETADEARAVADEALDAAGDATATAAEAREAVAALDDELDELSAAVESAADADDLAALSDHVESEVPTWLAVERVFAPTADRVDGDGRHPDLGSAIEEVDAELRRTHRLREAGLLGRLRWLLTGELPE